MPASVSLSLFWLLHFGGLGIFFPYFGLYLRENAALDGTRVGLVLAAVPLAGIVAQPLWGQLADRTGRRSALLTLLTLGTAAGYVATYGASGFGALLAATVFMSLFGTSVIPAAVSVTLAALSERGPNAFGRVRVWGTVGYLVCVVGFPWGLHRVQDSWLPAPLSSGPSEPGLELMFLAAALLSAGAALLGPLLPRGGSIALRAERGDWRRLLAEPAFLRILAFTLLAFFFLQGPMGIFPIYVRASGGDLDTVGRMWVVMLVVEIPLVALSGTGLRRLGARGLLAIGVLAGGLRWTVCALVDDLPVIYAMQALHGVTVTGLLLGGPLYVESAVPERLRSTAQALLATVGTGIGGILSNAVAGWMLERMGPTAPYLYGGVGALGLAAAVGWLLPGLPARQPAYRGYREGPAPAQAWGGNPGEQPLDQSEDGFPLSRE
jgi:PPP family 3-phenylpropionic acid transporter